MTSDSCTDLGGPASFSLFDEFSFGAESWAGPPVYHIPKQIGTAARTQPRMKLGAHATQVRKSDIASDEPDTIMGSVCLKHMNIKSPKNLEL